MITIGSKFKVAGIGWATVIGTCQTSGLVCLEFTHRIDDTPYPFNFRRSIPSYLLL